MHATSQTYQYSVAISYSNEIHCLVSPAFTSTVRYTTSKCSTRSFLISLGCRVILPDSFFPGTANLWNILPRDCFPEDYNLKALQSKRSLPHYLNLLFFYYVHEKKKHSGNPLDLPTLVACEDFN